MEVLLAFYLHGKTIYNNLSTMAGGNIADRL